MINWKERGKAAGIHFGASAAVAVLAAILVFFAWYPWPYRDISGGRELFMLVVGVDIVLGPLITFAIFNRAKPWTELRRDLAIVVIIQLAGLSYGLWTVAIARPVHLVFEYDRFRVVHAVDIPDELRSRAPEALRADPWLGPTTLALRPFRDEAERTEATMLALRGLPLSARPDLWQPYEDARARVLEVARPVTELKTRRPAAASSIDSAVAPRRAEQLAYVPMAARKTFWTVFIDPQTSEVVGFAPIDSF